MRLYYKAGDRTTALRQYERCVAALAREFDLPPAQETVALYEQIRADHLEGTTRQGPLKPPPHPAPAVDLALYLRQRLDQIQSDLLAIQYLLQHGPGSLCHYRHWLPNEDRSQRRQ
jgi:hypothetical protein